MYKQHAKYFPVQEKAKEKWKQNENKTHNL